MAYIELHNWEKEEIVGYLSNNTIPTKFESNRNSKRNFKTKAEKFHYCGETSLLKYISSPDINLRFFTLEERQIRTDFINLLHIANGHAGQDRLYNIIKTLAYGIIRSDILELFRF